MSAKIDGNKNKPPPGTGCIAPNSIRRLFGLNALIRLMSGSTNPPPTDFNSFDFFSPFLPSFAAIALNDTDDVPCAPELAAEKAGGGLFPRAVDEGANLFGTRSGGSWRLRSGGHWSGL
jgi:hypothetical protein